MGYDYFMEKPESATPFLSLLRNQLDITQVPFSDRGSRILIYKYPDKDQLFIKLAERLIGLQPGIEAYLQRPPFICDLTLVDENGQPLDFELETSPQAVYFRTRIGEFGLVFQDRRTMSFGLPTNTSAGLRFQASPEIWIQKVQGGELKTVRNVSWSTNGTTLKNQVTRHEGGHQVEFMVQGGDDLVITIHISSLISLEHEVLPFSQASSQAEQRWREWFNRVPMVKERYRRTYAYAWWVMSNNLISPSGSVRYEGMMPSKNLYVGLWLWDSAMHALAYRHISPQLARDQIRCMLENQLPDGMLPDAIYDEGVVSEIDHPIRAAVTKPPILAWAALKLHGMSPDLDFLRDIYIPLVRWNAWWFSMNDDDVDGLVQYNHPYSSGLDDSPLWDYGMPVESPDLNTYLCVQMGSLAVIAEELGLVEEGKMWRRRARAIVKRMVEDFWDEEAGVFRALVDEEPIPVITPFNLYPLWTGQLPEQIRDRLLEHLRDPDMFWGGIYAAHRRPQRSPL